MEKVLRLLVVFVTLIAFAAAPMAVIAAETGDKPPATDDKAKKDDKTKKDDKAKKPDKKPIKPPDEGC